MYGDGTNAARLECGGVLGGASSSSSSSFTLVTGPTRSLGLTLSDETVYESPIPAPPGTTALGGEGPLRSSLACAGPLSREHGAHATVKTRFWP